MQPPFATVLHDSRWVTRGQEAVVPRRVLNLERETRRQALRVAIKGHVLEMERQSCAPSKIYIVCHWGVLYTLLRGKRNHFQNLECIDVTTDEEGEGFLDVNPPKDGNWRGEWRAPK